MKIYGILSVLAVGLGMTMASCSSDVPEQKEEVQPTGKATLKIGEVSIGEMTRYLQSPKEVFRNGDAIGLLIYNADGTVYNEEVQNVPAVYNGGRWDIDASPIIYDLTSPLKVVAYYPYSPAYSSENNGTLQFDVDNGYTDTLYTRFTKPSSNGELSLLFYHNESAVNIYLAADEEYYDLYGSAFVYDISLVGNPFEYYNGNTWEFTSDTSLYYVKGFSDLNNAADDVLHRITENVGYIETKPFDSRLETDYKQFFSAYVNGVTEIENAYRNCTFDISFYVENKEYEVKNIPIKWQPGHYYNYYIRVHSDGAAELQIGDDVIQDWDFEPDVNLSIQ